MQERRQNGVAKQGFTRALGNIGTKALADRTTRSALGASVISMLDHCILLRSLKVILPGLRNSIRRR
jgi:hypothetical protein